MNHRSSGSGFKGNSRDKNRTKDGRARNPRREDSKFAADHVRIQNNNDNDQHTKAYVARYSNSNKITDPRFYAQPLPVCRFTTLQVILYAEKCWTEHNTTALREIVTSFESLRRSLMFDATDPDYIPKPKDSPAEFISGRIDYIASTIVPTQFANAHKDLNRVFDSSQYIEKRSILNAAKRADPRHYKKVNDTRSDYDSTLWAIMQRALLPPPSFRFPNVWGAYNNLTVEVINEQVITNPTIITKDMQFIIDSFDILISIYAMYRTTELKGSRNDLMLKANRDLRMALTELPIAFEQYWEPSDDTVLRALARTGIDDVDDLPARELVDFDSFNYLNEDDFIPNEDLATMEESLRDHRNTCFSQTMHDAEKRVWALTDPMRNIVQKYPLRILNLADSDIRAYWRILSGNVGIIPTKYTLVEIPDTKMCSMIYSKECAVKMFADYRTALISEFYNNTRTIFNADMIIFMKNHLKQCETIRNEIKLKFISTTHNNIHPNLLSSVESLSAEFAVMKRRWEVYHVFEHWKETRIMYESANAYFALHEFVNKLNLGAFTILDDTLATITEKAIKNNVIANRQFPYRLNPYDVYEPKLEVDTPILDDGYIIRILNTVSTLAKVDNAATQLKGFTIDQILPHLIDNSSKNDTGGKVFYVILFIKLFNQLIPGKYLQQIDNTCKVCETDELKAYSFISLVYATDLPDNEKIEAVNAKLTLVDDEMRAKYYVALFKVYRIYRLMHGFDYGIAIIPKLVLQKQWCDDALALYFSNRDAWTTYNAEKAKPYTNLTRLDDDELEELLPEVHSQTLIEMYDYMCIYFNQMRRQNDPEANQPLPYLDYNAGLPPIRVYDSVGYAALERIVPDGNAYLIHQITVQQGIRIPDEVPRRRQRRRH